MANLKQLEKEALNNKMNELEQSDEMKKLKQKQARINDQIARLKKRESEKERRERNHRLIFLGANVEKFFGYKVEEGSKEMACLIHYLPIIKREMENGKFDSKWEELQQANKENQDE